MPAVSAVVVIVILVALGASAGASLHAILYKRDVRAAIGWTGFIWIAPFFGPFFYLLFGVNRIQRRAKALRRRSRASNRARVKVLSGRSIPLARVGDRVLGTSMTGGNRITVHPEGANVFELMLQRIAEAQRSVSLTMYIFERDETGRRFIEALSQAATRGVEVRVLIDAVGSRSAAAAIVSDLSRSGARAAQFLPAHIPAMRTINLRNHRKAVVVDGCEAFTGGMNIANGYAMHPAASPIRDTQFRIEGPLVRDLQESFALDWVFTTGESLEGETWFPSLEPRGSAAARLVADGPDESFEFSRWVILGAIAAAQRYIRIVTPYFVPDQSLVMALNVASLRGVAVEIVIPEVLDHRVVKWASNALLWQVLEKGCRIWFSPPPFDHSKLFTVDGLWTFFGSSNWDSRSLRLNFELNVEAFDSGLAHRVERLFIERRTAGREVTLADMDARSIPVRLRDGIARLFSPYL
jgi:cardiolipin synthase A/B